MKLPRTFVLSVILGISVHVAYATPVAPKAENEIALLTINSGAVVLNATAQNDGRRHQIRGYALRSSTNKVAGGGHVDFKAGSPSDESMLVEHVALLPTPLPRGVHGRSTFYWHVPTTVPHGSRVELRYHTVADGAASSRTAGSELL